MLEYWETGFLAPISLGCGILQGLMYAQNIDGKLRITGDTLYSFLGSFAGFIVLFLFMLFFATRKTKDGKNAFGGADIWVMALIGFVLGPLNSLFALGIACIVLLIYALIYKAVKKEKVGQLPFVPFISVGTIIIGIYKLITIIQGGVL